MFFDLVRRNSKRNRKENGLFFASLLVTIVAFYIILSLEQQDVIRFLRLMESDAVNKLLAMLPVFYGASLFLLFFLIYFASKYQLERRSHEFGIYLMLGMRRAKLFALLLAEDLWSSVLSLLIGIPVALLVSEGISLVTAQLVGIGILGHQLTFSWQAVLGTAVGFLLIKLVAFVILSGKIARREIGRLLAPASEGQKKRRSNGWYFMALAAGIVSLAAAYLMAIFRGTWRSVLAMGGAVVLGIVGTFLLFYGLRVCLGAVVRRQKRKQGLFVFTVRQLQEHVMEQSHSLAVSSLLVFVALCCFGFGIAVSWSYSAREEHLLDYTFTYWEESGDIQESLEKAGLEGYFDQLFEMKTGYIWSGEEETSEPQSLQMEEVMALLEQEKNSASKEVLMSQLRYAVDPHVIALSGYNQLLALAGEEPIQLEPGQAAVYMDNDGNAQWETLMGHVLAREPKVQINGDTYHLVGKLHTENLVVDRSITLFFALIVSDEDFDRLTQGRYDSYWDATLTPDFVEREGMTQAISQINQELDKTGLEYESYLQNMGRQLFYVVAASYTTLYLAVIFLVIANTMAGVQFLMRQRKTGKRYRTLIRLGCSYEMLCASAKTQVCWYFGLPIGVAVMGSLFGVRALFTGLLPSSIQSEALALSVIALAMICFLGVVEWGYVLAVVKASNRHILSLMELEREE